MWKATGLCSHNNKLIDWRCLFQVWLVETGHLSVYWLWFVLLFFWSVFEKNLSNIILILYKTKSCLHLEPDTKVKNQIGFPQGKRGSESLSLTRHRLRSIQSWHVYRGWLRLPTRKPFHQVSISKETKMMWPSISHPTLWMNMKNTLFQLMVEHCLRKHADSWGWWHHLHCSYKMYHWAHNAVHKRQNWMLWWLFSLQKEELQLKHVINWSNLFADFLNGELKLMNRAGHCKFTRKS